VTGELQQKLKIRAAEENVTIESLCVRFLWWGLDTEISGEMSDEKVDSAVDSQDMESKDKHAAVPGVRTGNNKQLPASRVGIDVRSYPKASSLLRPAHDPKTCKVHRCGLCAVAKEK
jgi:hypothetical protein